MRTRFILAFVLLALPAVSDAQRLPRPRIWDRGPAHPVPLPPTPNAIRREMTYVRLPYTVETYPFFSYFDASGLTGRLNSWSSGGVGERVDHRLSRQVSLTLDLTQSFVGGPAVTQTFELGTRVRPQYDADRKWYPFFDLRGGALLVNERDVRPYDYVNSSAGSGYSQLSHGFGVVAGTGIEYAIHRLFTLTTTGSVFRTSLAPSFGDSRGLGRHTLTAVRYSIGLRYNPGRWSMPPNLPQSTTQ